MPIGVDEWVAQHTDRQDAGTGWRRWMYTAEARVGWFPRLGIVFVLGLLFAQLSLNSNIEQVAINCLIYAILAVGLNIAVGWAGLLDLAYVAYFGFGAYGYAVLSSGNVHWSAIASIPVVFVAAAVSLGAVIGLSRRRVSGLPGHRHPVRRPGVPRGHEQRRYGHLGRRQRAFGLT